MKKVAFEHGKIGFTGFDYDSVTISSTIDNTIPAQWSLELEEYLKARRFMENFAVVKDDLQKGPGDVVHISKRKPLLAAGDLAENVMLEGNEEKMSYDQVSFTPAERGNAVALTYQADAKSIFDNRQEAMVLLGDWAAQKIDKSLHAAAAGVTQRLYGGNRTNMSALTSADKLTPAMISKAKYYLRKRNVPGFNTKVAPGSEGPGTDKDGHYVMVARPEQIFDLTQHEDYKKAAQNVALIEQTVSDVFKGFKGFWDGVMIFDSTNVYFDNPGSYTVDVAKAVMFGPRFLARAVGFNRMPQPYIWHEQIFDYGRVFGIAVRWFDQCGLLNAENGVGLFTAATDLS